LLLGAGAVSAQTMKTDETPARVPAAQQNAPAETAAPAPKSGQFKAPETTGQAAPTAPEADKKQMKSQTLDRAPAGAAAKGSSDTNGSTNVKSQNSAVDGATSPPRKTADESKRSTTGQVAANEGGPTPVRHRRYRHRHCLPNIFDHGNCWR